ncbi:PspC domain-containing protein [Nocardia sp. NPDC057227]|uniref:PspC domain-containing protein n=1 Tax=Nocardia sp. NPDC057227 TaxID=3346056 RepID=UPI00363A51B8
MKTSIGDQLQQLWQTRPVRMSRQGPVAGVAAGFGRRYDIDPVLVRIAFVVSTLFGGAGVVLYLLAWLMLDDAGDPSVPPRSLLDKSQSQTKTVVLIVALAIAVSTMGPIGVGLGGSGLISMALMLGGWWLLHLRQPEPPLGLPGQPVTSFGGFPATGYPGVPAGSPLRSVGDMFRADPGPYSPYTKLPEFYVPEQDRAATTPLRAEPEGQRPDLTKAAADPEQIGETSATGAAETSSGTAGTPADATGPGTAGLSAHATDIGTAGLSADATGPGAAGLSADAAERSASSGIPAPERPNLTKSPTPAARHPFPTPVPPSWDPLGVAPLAWDLPEPTPAKTPVAPPERRPRSRLTPVTIGLAILAAGAAGSVAAAGAAWMTPAMIGGAALAVLSIGLLVGAFLRRGHGLYLAAVPLAGFVLLASLIGPMNFDRADMGEHVWTAASASTLEPAYRVNMGNATLDLRELALTENRAVQLEVRMGEAEVLLPADLTVNMTCATTMGESNCVPGISGPATPGAPVLDLKIDVVAGNVEVHRG